ncbi:MAG TPA: hypothetical protein VKU00_08830 [Chthonomonadaceae bacterium]|nr:hypothetical protein [Chthonomonadaceae bacterium]
MTLTLKLTPEEEAQLSAAAAEQGMAPDEYVLQAVRHLLPGKETAKKIEALRSLLDDDEEEQRETGEYLLHALDEDRLSSRKLFT